MVPSPIPESARPAQASVQNPARVVVVVPRKEAGLHEYLRRSLGALKNVEVVLDRRAAAVPAPDERRQSAEYERRILICSLVRCPPTPVASSADVSDSQDVGQPRTLLWPALREPLHDRSTVP
jgi:hypothetical protein